ncbi:MULTISPECIES: conjugal transfer protein TrbE [unclassified Fusobacterium]|uniref:TraG/VirB4 family ATPase n=1 Tax=unclassified Fusobacterium TaxID=2648384 RepID=UPI001B8B9936|nr:MULTISPECIES: conjugal transfer protein TrbE [unclassified Fusobacterium]MBR8700496.1 Type IV secretion system protein virB4 [Fusobacterium sp. DD45]MBR8710239.1 Type IV secretion system protein virB4 [Fusobacterium sp. DD28]MBR8750761.1 Type IV secretion system protein virB4 [Fusobacterium sp. DD26]
MDIIIFMGFLVAIMFYLLKQAREYDYDSDPKVIDYLPWGYLVEDGIIFNKNGSLQQSFSIRGYDIKSMEDIDTIDFRAKLNNIFKRMNGNWSFHVESRRRKAKPYIHCKFQEKVLQLIDNVRGKKYNSGNFYISEYFITFTWLPPMDLVNKVQDKIILDDNKKEDELNLNFLKDFKASIKEFSSILKNCFQKFESLNDRETLTYLHSCFSQYPDMEIEPLRKSVFLDAYLSDTPITDGFPTKVGDNYIGIVSLLSYPTDSWFSMFHELDELGIEYRWVSRFICQDKEDSVSDFTKKKGKWASNRKSIMASLEDKAMKQDRVTNFEAEIREKEATAILTDVQDDAFLMGYYTFTIICKDKDLSKLDKKLDSILEIVQNKGFVAIKETVDFLQAFFGSMPGNIQHNVRKVPFPTLIAIDLMQFTSIYSGKDKNTHLKGAPLLIANSTNGSTAIYFNLNVGDVGHTAIYGKTGGGKSVFLAFLAAQFKKYKDSQVFFFDKGGSSRVLTTAIRGKFNDLGSSSVKFQPLGNIGENEIDTTNLSEEEITVAKEKERERAAKEKDWAFEWLCDIYEQENVILTPELKESIANALNSVAVLPKSKRTITQFSLAIQKNELRVAITPYTKDGSFGRYFDANEDSFTKEFAWQVFEMDKVMESKFVAPPMLKYIFHKLEVEMFTGKPTLLLLDECWRLLDNESFAQKLKQWLKELRKKCVYVVFATQEITDILNSSIKDTLINSCPTTIYLPNKKATSSTFVELYRGLGLNDKQIETIANLESKKDYYAVSSEGNLDIRPNFSEFELAFFGASSQVDQNKCIEIEEELNNLNLSDKEFEEEFLKKWMQYKKINLSLIEGI